MKDVTTQQKLQLVRQVRSRYHEDQYDLFNRERILYGRTSVAPERGLENPYSDLYRDRVPMDGSVSSFRLRLFLAVFLVMLVIAMDRNNIEVAGITTEKIYEAISADYEEVLETWVETLSNQ